MKVRRLVMVCVFCLLLSGCATFRKAKQADMLKQENRELQRQLESLQNTKDAEIKHVALAKDKELQNLERAKQALEEQLKKEIGEYKAKLEMTERGLVITFLSEIFFDSGKDSIRSEGSVSLDKVAEVLNINVPDTSVAVEGHTDNDPIRYSAWKSNWELSAARALSVVHYLIDECGVGPKRLSAVGYGEQKPVTSNDIASGKQQNRRVEIVILPSQIKKIKGK